jgi:tRNA threonylcarbamoyladenosine biosynthesis protein TsaE
MSSAVIDWPLAVTTTSVAATRDLAARLAPLCRAGDIVLLVGDLSAGKTAFAQGFARGLGVAGPVTSPTFALVRQYSCGADSPVRTLIHADIYRTESLGEVEDLALAELVEDDAVAVVEWGNLAAPALGQSALDVTLVADDDDPEGATRAITVAGRGSWSQRVGEIAAAWPEAAPVAPS